MTYWDEEWSLVVTRILGAYSYLLRLLKGKTQFLGRSLCWVLGVRREHPCVWSHRVFVLSSWLQVGIGWLYWTLRLRNAHGKPPLQWLSVVPLGGDNAREICAELNWVWADSRLSPILNARKPDIWHPQVNPNNPLDLIGQPDFHTLCLEMHLHCSFILKRWCYNQIIFLCRDGCMYFNHVYYIHLGTGCWRWSPESTAVWKGEPMSKLKLHPFRYPGDILGIYGGGWQHPGSSEELHKGTYKDK